MEVSKKIYSIKLAEYMDIFSKKFGGSKDFPCPKCGHKINKDAKG